MSFDSQKKSAQASTQPRDSNGHFIKTATKETTAAASEGKDILQQLVKTTSSTDDTALVDVKVTNPLHKISLLLQDIKTHQSTTFDLKFTIPLIALPIFLLAAFQLGRINTSCLQTFTSKTGTLHVLSIMAPVDTTPNIWQTMFSFVPLFPKPVAKKDLVETEEAILSTDDNTTLTIVTNYLSSLAKYDDKHVVVSGYASACTNSMTLDAKENIGKL